MYSDNPQVLKDYAAFVQVPEAMARRVRDGFFPKALVDPDQIKASTACSRRRSISSSSARR